MTKKTTLLTLCALLFAHGFSAGAQQPGKTYRIGYLSTVSPSAELSRLDSFRQALRDFGYAEGKNIVIESRFAGGKLDRLAEFSAELVRLKVDVIVTGGSPGTEAAQRATRTIPLVMTLVGDPVPRFVTSLAKPGGNITGLTQISPQLGGKRLELLKEVVPKLSHVAVFENSTAPGYAPMIREMEVAANAFKVQLQYQNILDSKDIETAFRAASKGRADAVVTFTSAILSNQRAQIVELATKNRLPAIYHNSPFVEVGGLMTYGVSFTDLDRRAATYVDKILKGAKPADLPVEQPTKFEFVVNFKAAKQIGLTIPPNVLARADRVIR